MRRHQYLFSVFLALYLASFGLPSLAHSTATPTSVGDTQVGVASYYSDKFHGRRTANGERYDRNGLTAMHPRLPFGTVIKVTNLRNNRSIHLRINDRTRLRGGRLLDVSKRAAQELGFIGSGLAKVEIEIVRYGDS
jgi:rare lipoprotein A